MVTYFRLYDPLEPHRSWAMLDIEPVSHQRGVYAASLFKLQARFSFHSLWNFKHRSSVNAALL